MVTAANVAAASAQSPAEAQQITRTARLLAETLAAQLRAAKVASSDDPQSIAQLQEASQSVSDSIGDLLKL